MLNIHSRRMSNNDSHNRAQNKSDQGCKQLPIRFTQLWPLNLQVLTWSTRQVLVLLCMSVLVEDLPSELFKEHRVAFTKQHIIGFRMLQSAPVTSLEFIGRCRACQGRLICESLSRKRAWKSEVVRREMSHDVTWCHHVISILSSFSWSQVQSLQW
jgi:hypothetical protein